MVGGMKERAPVGSSGSLWLVVLFLLLGRPIVAIMLLSRKLNVVNRSEVERRKKKIMP
jgi:hypothetical protein